MNNKELGNAFEKELCRTFYSDGFWTHNFATKTAGQPADIIIAKNGRAFLIDAKVCTNDKFDLNRIEENQKNAMFLWDKCGNGACWFALKMSNGIFMVNHNTALMLRQTRRYINAEEAYEYGETLIEWLEVTNTICKS